MDVMMADGDSLRVCVRVQAKTYTDEVERQLQEAMALPKTLAWGEIGLDYHYNLSDPEKQREVRLVDVRKCIRMRGLMCLLLLSAGVCATDQDGGAAQQATGDSHARSGRRYAACPMIASDDAPGLTRPFRPVRRYAQNHARVRAEGLASARPLLHVVHRHGQVPPRRVAQPFHRLHRGMQLSLPFMKGTPRDPIL